MGLTQITTGGVDDNINIDSNTLKVDGTNNRVGIGTAAPEVDLHVKDGNNGEVKIGGSSSVTGLKISYSNSGNTTTDIHQVYRSTSGNALLNIDTGTFTVSTGTSGNERLRIDSSGRLLINTTTVLESSSAAKLHIAHTSGALIALGRNDAAVTDGNDMGKIAFYGNDGGGYEKVAQITCEADGPHASGDKPGRIMFQTTADNASSPTERMRIDSSGRLLINHTADTAPQGYSSKLQLCDTSYQGSSLLIRRDGGASGPALLFAKSRGTTQGAHTAVQVNDNIGTIRFFAADGTDTNSEPVQIRAQIDNTPGSDDTPGRLIFSTATDGSATATERMRLNSKGQVWITDGYTPADINDEIRLALRGSQPKLQIQGVGSGYTEGAVLCHAPTSSRGGGIYMHNDNNGGTHI